MTEAANEQANPELSRKAEGDLSFFEKFAEWAAGVASRAPFFAFCVLLILVWAPSFTFLPFDTWQLIINTATTIITFLMVALLQNSQKRTENANNYKQNVIADALADYFEVQAGHYEDPEGCARLRERAQELRTSMGIEKKISA